MNFTDTLKVQALTFAPNYSIVSADGRMLNFSGYSHFLSDGVRQRDYDNSGNPIEPEQTWVAFGKEKNAIIFPNSKASKIALADGREFQYSYEVVVKLKKSLYPIIPREGDRVWIRKSDGTIDKEMEVVGFVTLKQRYLKLWL